MFSNFKNVDMRAHLFYLEDLVRETVLSVCYMPTGGYRGSEHGQDSDVSICDTIASNSQWCNYFDGEAKYQYSSLYNVCITAIHI